jgi:formylmethanofuran dehydrogenase subunit E
LTKINAAPTLPVYNAAIITKEKNMRYPDFFDNVPAITLRDPLAKVLGAAEGGMITYTYTDAVKLTGHSCPTVAGAYLMTLIGLEALYKEAIPVRGGIEISFRECRNSGTSGVIANVMGLITGAATEEGFKGMNGRFGRNGLLSFGAGQKGAIVMKRTDSGKAVSLGYHPQHAGIAPLPPELVQRVLERKAASQERADFARMWQQNVEAILSAYNDPKVVTVEPLR